MAGNSVNYPKERENKLPPRVKHSEKKKIKTHFLFGGNELQEELQLWQRSLLFLDQLEQTPGKLRPVLHGAAGLVCAPVC